MKLTYQQFLKANVDLAPLGVLTRRQYRSYFCTPKGARIFGVSGVDGIHFCFVRGFGETVFVVSPMNGTKDCVHPVAKSFQDFLRLLLACHDAAAIEQVWQWSAEQLDAFEKRHAPTPAQQEVLERLEKELGLRPMAEPWKYIHTVQAGFDYAKLRFGEEFYDAAPRPATRQEGGWKVVFGGGFSGGSGRGGSEIPIRKTIDWEGEELFVPAAYSCAKGLVIDLAKKVPPERIRAFCEKWDLSPENDGRDFTAAQRRACEQDNPLEFHFNAQAIVNGRALPEKYGCMTSWNPLFEDMASEDARAVLAHYGLDAGFGWSIWRVSFPWQTARKPKISALELALRQKPIWQAGPAFRAEVGAVSFSHLGEDYTLRVLKEEIQDFSERFSHEDWGTLYATELQYEILPQSPRGEVRVKDTAPPFSRPAGKKDSAAAASIGIIGGADGPTVLFTSGQGAISSLRCEKEQAVTWQIMLRSRGKAPLQAKLL